MWYSAIGCLVTLILSLLAAPLAAQAQPAEKMPRLGVLVPGVPPGEPGGWLDRFRQGLRDLGYVEGQTIALEVRWDAAPPRALAGPCCRPGAAACGPHRSGDDRRGPGGQACDRTIPIVIAVSADPVGVGLVASLARPGGNVTGLSS